MNELLSSEQPCHRSSTEREGNTARYCQAEGLISRRNTGPTKDLIAEKSGKPKQKHEKTPRNKNKFVRVYYTLYNFEGNVLLGIIQAFEIGNRFVSLGAKKSQRHLDT